MPTTSSSHAGPIGQPKLLLHRFIDLAEIRAVAQQQAEGGEVGEQHAVHKRSRGQSFTTIGVLPILLAHSHAFAEGRFRGLRTAKSLRTSGIRGTGLSAVRAAEVFRTLQRLRQQADRNGGGVRGQHGVLPQLLLGLSQHFGFDLRVLDHRFDHHVGAIEAGCESSVG